MKKIILAVSVILLAAACGQTKKAWTDTERNAVRTMVRNHQSKMILRHMAQDNFANIEDCVVSTVEGTYPDYNAYAKVTSQNDTVVGVLVDCVGEMIGPGYENLPKIFPYDKLVSAGVLPANLTTDQQNMFYVCVAGKIQGTFPNPAQFAYAMLHDSAASDQLSMMMKECADSMMNPDATKDAANAAAPEAPKK